MEISSRERILEAVDHKETDRVPIDLGGTDCSGIALGPYLKFCEHLGVNPAPIYIVDISQQIVVVDDEVADKVGSDAKVIWHLPDEWRDGHAYDGTPVKYPANFNPQTLPNGDKVILDKDGEAVLKMPNGGYFYDICKHPLKGVKEISTLDEHKDAFRDMDRPSWYDMPLEKLGKYVQQVRKNNPRALVGCFSGHVFQAGQFLRGWSEFLLDIAGNKPMAQAVMERLVEEHIKAFDRYADTVYKHVDIIEVCDDIGMQNNTWISPESYRKLVKPYHELLFSHIKKKSGARLLLHACGSISSILPDLIEVGVDILNPVQYSANKMDLVMLKRDFGRDICFWGGGIDTQKILPFGTPEQVADEVKRNIDILAPGGGFVFATVHNITEGVPLENIVALYKTVREYGSK